MLKNKMQLSSCADRRISIETWEVTYTVKVYDWHLSGNETRATNTEKETKEMKRDTGGEEDGHTGNIFVTNVAVIAQKPQWEMKMETQILAHLERSQVKSTEAGTLKSRNRNSHMLYVLTLLAAVLVGGSVEDASRKTRSNMYIYVETKCPQNCLNFLHHWDGYWQFSLVPKGKFVMLFWALCYDLLFGKWCTCCVK